MSTLRRVVRSAAAVLVTAAAGLGAAPTAPASAATCSSAHGVSVVVDFHELGGGVQTACVPGGGGDTAASLFPAAGFPLDYVQREPGFVCRVSGKPSQQQDACVSTPPSDAYWGLWWSDGTSGTWTYATSGAGSQRVPDGGSVAFSWNGSSTRSQPGVPPARHSASPSPSSTPSTQGSGSGSGSGGGHSSTPSGSATHAGSSAGAPTSAAPGSASGSASGSAQGSASRSPAGSPAGRSSRSATASTGPGGSRHHDGKAGAGAKAGPRSGHPKPHGRHRTAPASTSSAATTSPSATALPTADPTRPGGGLPSWVAPAALVVLAAGAGAAALVRRRRAPGS